MPPIPTHPMHSSADVLRYYLTYSPPDHALWKTVEWRLFRQYEYGEPVLDLGCGDGVFARLVFDRPLAAGIDILHRRVRKAAQAHAHRWPVTGDATALPFADGSFRTVFSGCAMEHVPPLPQMLDEIARVLQPGGRLITTVPSGYFPEYLWLPGVLRRVGLHLLADGYARLVVRLLTIFHLYQPARWQQLLGDAGLELDEAQYFLPRPATAMFDRLLLLGNAVQPLMWLGRGTTLHRRYVGWLQCTLTPYVAGNDAATTGGALLLVARKPH